VQTTEKLQLFTGNKSFPAIVETSVSPGSHGRTRGFTRYHPAIVTISVRVGEMCGCRIGAVGQESIQIRAIIIVLAGLRDCGAIENDCKLTEERVEEFID